MWDARWEKQAGERLMLPWMGSVGQSSHVARVGLQGTAAVQMSHLAHAGGVSAKESPPPNSIPVRLLLS